MRPDWSAFGSARDKRSRMNQKNKEISNIEQGISNDEGRFEFDIHHSLVRHSILVFLLILSCKKKDSDLDWLKLAGE
jgi:hypothetical protein